MPEVLSSAATFERRIATREARLGIVGLGYAGLPLASAFAEARNLVPAGPNVRRISGRPWLRS